MRKILIIGIALSLVLVSGGLFSAQANCGSGCLSSLSPCNWSLSSLSPCNWHFPSLCGFHCGSRDADAAPARVETTQTSCFGGCLSSLSPCNWHFPSFCGFGCGSKNANSTSARDADRPDATRQGAYYYGQITRAQMGSPGI